jgi:hypothetical protein
MKYVILFFCYFIIKLNFKWILPGGSFTTIRKKAQIFSSVNN